MRSPTIRIVFICHGNICRSTMAQSVLQHLVDQRGMGRMFTIDSAATTREEIGSAPHYGTQRILQANGIPVVPHKARLFTRSEVANWDLIVGMDEENMWGLRRIVPKDQQGRLYKLLEFAGIDADVADPWYTGNFEATFDDVNAGCRALLSYLGYQV